MFHIRSYVHYLIPFLFLVPNSSDEIITKVNTATSGSKKRKKYKKNRKHNIRYKKNRKHNKKYKKDSIYNKSYKKYKSALEEHNKKEATRRQAGEEFRVSGRPRCRSRRVARDRCQGLNNRYELFKESVDN